MTESLTSTVLVIWIFSFPTPNFLQPKSRLFSETKFFRNRDFFSETKFSKTKTETFFRDLIFFETETETFNHHLSTHLPRRLGLSSHRSLQHHWQTRVFSGDFLHYTIHILVGCNVTVVALTVFNRSTLPCILRVNDLVFDHC